MGKQRLSVRAISIWVLLTAHMVLPVAIADPPEGYKFVTFDQGMHDASKSGKKIFLYYGRYGCGFCDKTNKESFSSKEVYRRYTDHYILVYVDAEGDRRLTLPSGERITEQQLGVRMKVLGTPYFMFMEPDGSKIFSAPGFKTIDDLLQFDNYIHGNHYKSMSFSQYTKGAS